MQRPFHMAVLPVWHQEKASRGQPVDMQQVPGAPALSLRPETSRPAFLYETVAVPFGLPDCVCRVSTKQPSLYQYFRVSHSFLGSQPDFPEESSVAST